MPKLSFTQDAIAANKKLDAQWYELDILTVTSKPGTKDPSSTTWAIEMRVNEGPSAGVPVTHYINDASAGALKMTKAFSYLECFTSKIEAAKEYDIESTAGRKIGAYIQFDMERQQNTVLDFRKGKG